jgi:hypothetical protein
LAWFHRTLEDARRAIEEERWQDARDILDEHAKHFRSDDMDRDLGRAGVLLRTYSDKVQISRSILMKGPRGELRIPTGGDISLLKVVTKEAQESIHKFEKIIQKLNKEGKFQE